MRSMLSLLICLSFAIVCSAQTSESTRPPGARTAPQERGGACDSTGFIEAAINAERVRSVRKIDVKAFLELARDPKTIILDARGSDAFDHMHLKGAVNLPYTSFSQEALERIVPKKGTRILIYCRNNFTHIPMTNADWERLKSQPRPANLDLTFRKDELAGLNIPTFITLHIYGYTDVWELDSIIDPEESALKLVGYHEGLDKN